MTQPPEGISITCPECRTTYLLPKQNVGKRLRCTKCKTLFKISDESISGDEKALLSVFQEQLKERDRKIRQVKKQNLEFQEEVIRLKKLVEETKGGVQLSASQTVEHRGGAPALQLQLDGKNEITSVNEAFCEYAQMGREDVVGEHFSVLSQWMDEALFKSLKRAVKGESFNQIVKDGKGRIFDIRVGRRQNATDFTCLDISEEQRFRQFVQRYIPLESSQLNDEDLQTFKYPERRFMTVSCTNLRGFTSLSESMNPMEVRSTMNAYLEAIIHAIEMNSASVDKVVGNEVIAMFGAPRYFGDHALRAIKAGCDQMMELQALRISFSKLGRKMPHCSIGINTGDMVVGTMGSSSRQDYSVLGNAVHLATRMCRLTSGSKVFLSEATLKAALESIPEDWQLDETTALIQEDFVHEEERPENSRPLPPELQGKTIAIGPNVKVEPEKYEYLFEYLFAMEVAGGSKPLPIISVKRRADALDLVLDNERTAKREGERIFGRYRLLQVIGKGGMGEVWKAKDTYGNLVALKMLIAGEEATDNQLKRFKQEAEIMSRLHHQNICRIYEVGKIERVTYIAMEYIDGISLSTLLRYRGEGEAEYGELVPKDTPATLEELVANVISLWEQEADMDADIVDLQSHDGGSGNEDQAKARDRRSYILPLGHILAIINKVCEAVQYAHRYGILHRDIKPGNIMIRPDGSPVVMDFGLAKVNLNEDRTKTDVSLSVSGQIVGTIDYMSPEQALSSKDVNEQADVYAIGALLYQMLTGKMHFSGSGNMIADAQKLQEHVPVKLSAINKDVDFDLEVITLKALQNSPSKRYKSVNALRFDLNRFSRGHLIVAKSESQWVALLDLLRKNRIVTYVILSAITVVLTIMGWSVYMLRESFEISRAKAEEAARSVDLLHAAYAERMMLENQFPKLVEAAMGLAQARSLEQEGDLWSAMQAAWKMTETMPDWAPGWYHHGRYGQMLGLHNQALISFKNAASLNCSEPDFKERMEESVNRIKEYNDLTNDISIKRAKRAVTTKDLLEFADAKVDIGELDEAIEAYAQLCKDNDNLHARVRLCLAKMKKMNPNNPFIGSYYLEDDKDASSLVVNLAGTNASDFSSLQGLVIRRLDLSKSKVLMNKNPVVIQAAEIDLSGASVEDFSFINSSTIRRLILRDAKVGRAGVLENLNLDLLDVRNTGVDFLQRKKVIQVRELYINGTDDMDLDKTKGLQDSLKVLHLDVNGMDDLKPLESLKLEALYIDHMSNKDMAGINMPTLKTLAFANSKLDKFRGFLATPLETLEFSACSLMDISELLQIKTLRRFSLSDMAKFNFAVMRDNNIEHMELKNMREPLNMNELRSEGVKTLHLEQVEAKDFKFLGRFTNLVELKSIGAGFSDLSLLKNMPLQNLTLDFSRRYIKPATLLKIPSLSKVMDERSKVVPLKEAVAKLGSKK